MELFDKIPENFFTVLSRKYKACYAFALMVLFSCLKLYKTNLKKVDYINALKNQGEKIFELFNVDQDKLDDKEDEEDIQFDLEDSALSSKVNYIFRKLVSCGWINVEKNVETNTDMIYLPVYSIKMMQLIAELSSSSDLYVPLVHQTYSELSLEDEREDEYMFRTLASARKNADELEMNVTLLHHSICVFGFNLNKLYDPNEALNQHFNIFKHQVGDKLYHPMKTYDSLGLYASPVISILKKWQRDKRIVSKLASQAKYDPEYATLKVSDVVDKVNLMLQETIDIFSKLNSNFNDIDKANAKYTEAVQKKVNFLSSSDKTIVGKLDMVILNISKALSKLPLNYHGDYSEIDEINRASDTLNFYRAGFVNSNSLTMPFKRTRSFESEPMMLDDEIFSDDQDLVDFIEKETNAYSQAAIEEFMMKHFADKKTITSEDIHLEKLDDLILLILATVNGQFGKTFYKIDYIDNSLLNGEYEIPKYRFTKKGK